MSFKVVLLSVLLFASYQSYGGLDSLVQLAQSLPSTTEKVEVYRSIYSQYKYDNPDTVLYYLEGQLQLTKEIGDYRNHGLAFFRIALLNKRKGNYNLAIQNYLMAIEIFKQHGFHSLYGSALNNLGNMSSSAGNYASATKFFELAVSVQEHLDNKRELINALWNSGYCHLRQENFDDAKYYYDRALELSKYQDSPYLLNESYKYLGQWSFEQCHYNTAKEYLSKALQSTPQLSDYNQTRSVILNDIGMTFLNEDSLDRAEQYFQESLALKKSIKGSENSQMLTLTQLGVLAIAKNNYSQGVKQLEKAVELADTQIINEGLTDALSILSNAYSVEVSRGKTIDPLKFIRITNLYRSQLTKMRTLKERLEASDIQNVLYLRVELNKRESELIAKTNYIKQVSYLLLVVLLLMILSSFLYFKIRRKNKETKIHLDHANDMLNKTLSILDT